MGYKAIGTKAETRVRFTHYYIGPLLFAQVTHTGNTINIYIWTWR
jgi:hypothetical protein